jgi:hypothetical protein
MFILVLDQYLLNQRLERTKCRIELVAGFLRMGSINELPWGNTLHSPRDRFPRRLSMFVYRTPCMPVNSVDCFH